MIIGYNLVCLVLIGLWRINPNLNEKIKNWKYSWLIASSILLSIMMLSINLFLLGTDVDDAITSGTLGFLDGKNPYTDKVVLHHLYGEDVWSVYHYLPPDLYFHTITRFFLETQMPFVLTWLDVQWIVIPYLVILIPTYFIAHKISELSHQRFLPVFLVIISAFLFTNSILMLVLFVIGEYFHRRGLKMLAITFYILSASIKYMSGLWIIVMFLEDLKQFQNKRNWSFLKFYILPSLILFLLCLPFGIDNVTSAAFLYQGDPETREQVAQTRGPLLIELLIMLGLDNLYLGIFVILIGIILLLTHQMKFKKRVMIVSLGILLLLPFYGTELAIIPLFFWLLPEYVDKEGQTLNYPKNSST